MLSLSSSTALKMESKMDGFFVGGVFKKNRKLFSDLVSVFVCVPFNYCLLDCSTIVKLQYRSFSKYLPTGAEKLPSVATKSFNSAWLIVDHTYCYVGGDVS